MSSLKADRLKFEECKNKQYQLKELSELPSFAAQVLDAMNVQSCERSTSKTVTESEQWVQFLIGPRIGTTTVETKETSSVIGCEQLAVIAQRCYENTQKIKCILNQTSMEVTTVALAVNNVIFEAAGNLLIDCGEKGLEINQNAEVKVYASNNYTQSQVEAIEEVLINNIKENLETMRDSTVGFSSTPDGQKTIEETINKIESGEFNNEINQTVLSINTNVTARNNVIVKSGGMIKINGNRCKITQDAVIEIVANNMINSSMDKVLKTFTQQSKEYVKQEKLKSLLLEEDEKKEEKKETDNSIYVYVGIGITIIMIIIIIIIFLKKRSENQMMMQYPQGYNLQNPLMNS